MYKNILFSINIDAEIPLNKNEAIFKKLFQKFFYKTVISIILIMIINFMMFTSVDNEAVKDFFVWSFIIIYGFIIMPVMGILVFVPLTFCCYQKYALNNEDFKNFQYHFFITCSNNFIFILSYYLWKRKLKNTKCFIDNNILYLRSNSNHTLIDNFEIISKNPITHNALRGKVFLDSGFIYGI